MKKFEHKIFFKDTAGDEEWLTIQGEEGWEMCGVLPTNTGKVFFYFKRQIIT